MNVIIDIETCPAADKQPFIDNAKTNFKAPSDLTKGQAGADLGLSGDGLKYASKDEVIALWEKEMAEKKAPEVAEANWRKTSLDGTKGRILSIAWQTDKASGLHIGDPINERDTLLQFFDVLGGALNTHGKSRPPYFIGHNLTFDLKFLFRRSVILGIKPPFEFPFKGRHGSDYFCTMNAWCEFGERISLANLCDALSIDKGSDIDGSQVCDYWLAGRYSDIGAYNVEDVQLTDRVYRALTFTTQPTTQCNNGD